MSDEVGLGIVPMHPNARAYRDLVGIAHQRLAAHGRRGVPVRGGPAGDTEGREAMTGHATAVQQAVDRVRSLGPLDADAVAGSIARLDALTKPPGSLGRLEWLAIQLAGITGDPSATYGRRAIVVAAADHGVVRQGVSAYPAEVTAQMVANFLAGGAAINVLAGSVGRDGHRRRRRRRRRDPDATPPTGAGPHAQPRPSTDPRRHRRHDGRPGDVSRRGARRDRARTRRRARSDARRRRARSASARWASATRRRRAR